MNVDVVFLPKDLPKPERTRVVVVFDVLRATSTMTAALAAGVPEIRIFGCTGLARDAAAKSEDVLLCGEEQCLPPEGFDLGNSPGGFIASKHAGRTVCMSTTNGTRAILAADGAGQILAGALINASAVADRVKKLRSDVVLLCAGTNGEVATEDVLGAGAVLHALRSRGDVRLQSDAGWMAEQLFVANRADLGQALRTSRGGRNVIAAGLGEDVAFCARLDAIHVVGAVQRDGTTPVVRACAID